MKFINTITKKLARKIAKFILPELKNLFQDELSYSNHNLKYKMQQIASEDTAHFVLDNIPINKAFKDRYSLLAYCCNLLKEREKDTNGAILEFGVWKGSTINHMANILPNLQFFGFDSFEGLSEPWIFNDKGAFGNIKELPMVKENVKLIKGYFNDTLPSFISSNKEDIRLIHIDCDLYSSTVTILENISHLLKPGLLIIFDEFFNYPGWREGEYKAWIEFSNKNNIQYQYLGYTYQKNEKMKSGQQVALQIL